MIKVLTPSADAAPAIDFSRAAEWYDANANVFTLSTRALDTSELRDRFLDGLPDFARVLDAGCGAGRDLVAFQLAGLCVAGFDASIEMVMATRAATGHDEAIRHMGFDTFDDPAGSWDGIWAMASLIHVPRADLSGTVVRLVRSLTPTGRIYLAFKEGSGEAIDERGRPMSFVSCAEVADMLFAASPGCASVETWITTSPASGGETTRWVNALMVRNDS